VLDNAALKDLASKKLLAPDVKRKAVQHLMEVHELSERRACKLAELDPRVPRSFRGTTLLQ